MGLWLALAWPLAADNLRCEHLGVEDGLAHTTVWNVHQDRLGFIWIATEAALQRYDGHSFKSYKADPEDPGSLSANEVLLIHEDRQGVLWLGTRAGGLNRYDRAGERFVHYRHDAADPAGLMSDSIGAIHDDRDGALWIGTDAGLDRLDVESGTFTHYRHDPEDGGSSGPGDVTMILQDREGDLWVASYDGLHRLAADDLAGGQAVSFQHYRHDPEDPGSLNSSWILTLFEDRDGTLWVGTQGGLNRYDRPNDRFERVALPMAGDSLGDTDVVAMAEDRSGNLWVAQVDTGLSRWSAADAAGDRRWVRYRRNELDPHGLRSDWLLDLHIDRSGALWIGNRVGIDIHDRRRERFIAHRQGSGEISGYSVLGVTTDRSGAVWLGTVDDGLMTLDRARGTAVGYDLGIEDPAILPGNQVLAVHEDRFGELWVGTDGALVRLGTDRRLLGTYSEDPETPGALTTAYVRRFLEDRLGRLWIAGTTPVQRLVRSPEDGKPERFVTPGTATTDYPTGAHILDLYEDRSGKVWVATTEGLNLFDEEADRFIRHRHDLQDRNSLSSNVVMSVYQDAAAIFWLGTDGGLNRWDRTRGTFRHYRERDGLPSDRVVGVIEDRRGRLWLATGAGLSRFDPQTESFRNYDVTDGIHGNVFYIGARHQSDQGEFFFGGAGGLTSFVADRIEDDPTPPAMALTELRLSGEPARLKHLDPESPLRQSITDTRELILDHRQDVFSLEFAALHFANPRKNRYAYRLEGFEDTWSSADARQPVARYTNLDPGDYVFRAKAANPDGVWNEEGIALKITVLPPPWRTWWAYSLYGLALASVVLGYVLSHRKELRRERQAAESERQISRRLREVDKLKDEFLANTSHELRTPLYGITGLAESLVAGARGQLPEAVQADLSMVAASGRRLSHLVNDILDFSKLRHQSLELRRGPVDLKPIADVVLTLSRPLVGSKQLELINEVPADLPAADADEDRLQQILYNLMGNAIKFTESGEVEISAAVHDGMLQIRVRDTGIGIPEAHQERIFDAFEQADASVEREHGGTGLGLAVTRRLVELHGGTIDLRSTPGEGSTFFFSLPIAAERAPTVEAAEERPAPMPPAVEEAPAMADLAEAPAGAPRVLVVDDEPINLQVVRNYLAVEQFHLTMASSGEEALRLLEAKTFDLVLLDIMMPRVSGYEVCRSLRENHPISDLPVIFLTARTRDSDVVAGMELGANDYLAKPISKDRLLARVRPHLDLLHVHRHLETLVAEKVSEVKVLKGLLPICAGCKRIRDDDGLWNDLEVFIDSRSEAQFSHGMCPNCVGRYRAESSSLE